jgi:hypothetical protein
VVVLSIALVLVLATPALGDSGHFTDKDDVHGRLDIKNVSFTHAAHHHDRLIHRIALYKNWRSSLLKRGDREIHVLFDSDPNKGYEAYSFATERRVEIFFANGELHARLFNNLGDPPKKLAPLNVWRSGGNEVSFSIKKRQLNHRKSFDHYKWAVLTQYGRRQDTECSRKKPCFDYSPARNHSYYRHDL